MAGGLRPIKAIHEAGHAVVARVLGITVHFVSMRSTAEGNLGAVDTDAPYLLAKSLNLAQQTVVYESGAKVALAGLAAQSRAYPDTVPTGIVETEGDIATAQRLARTIVWIGAGHPLPDIIGGGPRSSSGSFATSAAMRRASSRVSSLWTTARPEQ